MNQYLTAEQRAQLEKRLAEDALSDGQKQAAFEQGMDMARADAAQRDALSGSGFDSIEALLAAYGESQSALREAEEALNQARALIRALENGWTLAPQGPEARSERVKKTWKRRAGAMEGLENLLPEVAEYIMAHPAFALEEDGLERAYDAVRAARYRSDEELLEDPENVKRLAADPRVRDAVLTAHLAAVYQAGRGTPAFIGDGGGIAAPEKAGDDMKRAGARLEAMLKRN